MTLAQAYDIKRKEVISLRYENEHLKKQLSDVFPVEEKAALESHIRHLEQIIRSKDSRYESARSFWKHTHERCSDLEFENSELKEKVRTLEDEIASLRSKLEITENEVRELNGTNKKLEKKLNISFENSSLPSSALPFCKKIPNSRKPSGRKPGAQPDHRSHNISRLHTTTEPVYISAPAEFLSDPDIYPTGKQIVKQLKKRFHSYMNFIATALTEYSEHRDDDIFIEKITEALTPKITEIVRREIVGYEGKIVAPERTVSQKSENIRTNDINDKAKKENSLLDTDREEIINSIDSSFMSTFSTKLNIGTED